MIHKYKELQMLHKLKEWAYDTQIRRIPVT